MELDLASKRLGEIVNKDNVNTFIDVITVALGGMVIKEDALTGLRSNRDRYMADVTMLPLKLTETEVGVVEAAFKSRPFVATSTASEKPIPNDLYSLKLTLLLTECLLLGIAARAGQVADDSKRREAVDKMMHKIKGLVEDSTDLAGELF